MHSSSYVLQWCQWLLCNCFCQENNKPKVKPFFTFKRNFSCFEERVFLSDFIRVTAIPDVELVWDCFLLSFLSISSKHVPFKKCWISGGDNPWLSDPVSEPMRLKNKSWAWGRVSDSSADQMTFWTLRNKSMLMIKKSKSEFYLKSVTENWNKVLSKFWKQIKSCSGPHVALSLAECVLIGSEEIKNKVRQFIKYKLNQIQYSYCCSGCEMISLVHCDALFVVLSKALDSVDSEEKCSFQS